MIRNVSKMFIISEPFNNRDYELLHKQFAWFGKSIWHWLIGQVFYFFFFNFYIQLLEYRFFKIQIYFSIFSAKTKLNKLFLNRH